MKNRIIYPLTCLLAVVIGVALCIGIMNIFPIIKELFINAIS